MADTLSIAVICGSLRSKSFNAAIAHALPALAPKGMMFRVLDGLESIPHYNADRQTEGFPRGVLEWAEDIRAADGVIFVTPEYNYSLPGVLKNAIDWLSRLSPGPFSAKPVAIQSASGGMLGGVRAQYHLRQVLVSLNALTLNKPEVMIAKVGEKISEQGELVDEATRTFLAEQLAAFEALIRQLGEGDRSLRPDLYGSYGARGVSSRDHTLPLCSQFTERVKP